MALIVEKTSTGREYKVEDLSQADFDRLEIELAEVDMPGLMACRTEYDPSKPFVSARIFGALHMTIQTVVLIETLTALASRFVDAPVTSSPPRTTLSPPSLTILRLSSHGKARRSPSTGGALSALDWAARGGPDLIIDDGGDATLLIHEGVKAEEEYEKRRKLADPASTDNVEFQIVLGVFCDGLPTTNVVNFIR